MKIIINEEKLREYMKINNIKNYKQLCQECGISYNAFQSSKSRRYTVSAEMYWLVADRLKCHVEDLQKIQK